MGKGKRRKTHRPRKLDRAQQNDNYSEISSQFTQVPAAVYGLAK